MPFVCPFHFRESSKNSGSDFEFVGGQGGQPVVATPPVASQPASLPVQPSQEAKPDLTSGMETQEGQGDQV